MARPAQGDHTAGLALLGAILAGLRVAERTGEGEVVETSLYESAIWTQATDFAVTAVDQAPVRRRSRHAQLTPVANRYPCGDGKWVVLNNLRADSFEQLANALDKPEWLHNERYKDGSSRYRHMAELVDAIDDVLMEKTRDEWGEIFDVAGIIWGPVLSLDEVAVDPQAAAIGMFPEIEHDSLGRYASVRIPMRFRASDVAPRGPAPELGEHTMAILRGCGMNDEEIQQLLESEAIK
jgi:crotonobetainyl-CoA:carnitine CoA-transferase CaiB-like acyl-CoA transferase